MNLKNIKLIASDLDGTLFTKEKKIDRRAIAAIRRLAKKGIQLVPVTGRPFSGLSNEILNIKEISYAVTNNGSEIIDLKAKKPIYSKQIKNAQALEIIKRAESLNTVFEVFANGYGYLTQKSLDDYMNIHGTSPVGQYIKSSRKIIDSIYDFIKESGFDADEIFITIPSVDIKKKLENMLNTLDDIQYWSIFGSFMEITDKEADKGKAFRFLADYLHVDMNSTIAFGDGENDITLLKSAGVSVAMDNAETCVKSIADIITASNDDFGVAKILEQL